MRDSHVSGTDRSLNSAIERLALSWAVALYVSQAVYSPVSGATQETSSPGPDPAVDITPIALPTVDENELTAEQAALWPDLRLRFVNTAARVHEARIYLNQLSQRLSRQNMLLNSQDASVAALMQGFLEDAARQISARQFAAATDALIRADYTHRRLRGVTGR